MPASKQQPLAMSKSGDPHDFSQSRVAWEVAVFDRAAYFFTLELVSRTRNEFKTFSEAVVFAQDNSRCLVYGVTPSERSALFDREKWDEWLEREKLTRPASLTDEARKQEANSGSPIAEAAIPASHDDVSGRESHRNVKEELKNDSRFRTV